MPSLETQNDTALSNGTSTKDVAASITATTPASVDSMAAKDEAFVKALITDPPSSKMESNIAVENPEQAVQAPVGRILGPKDPPPSTLNENPKTSNGTEPHATTNNGTTKFTTVGVWNLHPDEHAEFAPPANAESIYSVNSEEAASNTVEAVIGYDERLLVDKRHFMPGGKYRSIVKLFLRYAGQEDSNQPWAMATGWLIKPDLLVTAGHCAYDWSHGLGNLTHVKAYIGYCGQESVTDTTNYAVQFRTGRQVATTSHWLNSGNNKAQDVSFIQLSLPFDNVTPFQFADTPLSGSFSLGVVGYPGDLRKQKTGEKGACMYEMFLRTSFDVSKAKYRMLEYLIDTFGGNSGSPVLRLEDLTSIGVHVYGGNPNSASIINGAYGNRFEDYITALDAFLNASNSAIKIEQSTGSSSSWLYYASVPSSQVGGEESSFPTENEPPSDTEGLFDFLKDAISVAAPIASSILQIGLPIALGPVGVPVGALAGVALSAAGRLAQNGSRTESDIIDASQSYSFDGVVERAILGEAALAAMVHLGKAKCEEEGIFSDMTKIVKKIGPVIKKIGPKVLPVIAEPALRIALDELRKSQMSNTEAAIDESQLAIRELKSFSLEANTLGFGRRLDYQGEKFVKGLADSITQQDTESFLSVMSSIGDVVVKGLRIASPILQTIALEGLSRLAQGTEADIEDNGSSSFEGLAQRALAGEAALQALMKIPAETLEAEGLFEVMKKVITTIGPIVLKAAPAVIEAVGPIVAGAIAKSGTESSFQPGKGSWSDDFTAESAFLNDLDSSEAIFGNVQLVPLGLYGMVGNDPYYYLSTTQIKNLWKNPGHQSTIDFKNAIKALTTTGFLSTELSANRINPGTWGKQCINYAAEFYSALAQQTIQLRPTTNKTDAQLNFEADPMKIFDLSIYVNGLNNMNRNPFTWIHRPPSDRDISYYFAQAFEKGTSQMGTNKSGVTVVRTTHQTALWALQVELSPADFEAMWKHAMENYCSRLWGRPIDRLVFSLRNILNDWDILP